MLALLFQTSIMINLSVFLYAFTFYSDSLRVGTNRKSFSNKFVMISKTDDVISNIKIPRIGVSEFSKTDVRT
jgi:hypothetical protein